MYIYIYIHLTGTLSAKNGKGKRIPAARLGYLYPISSYAITCCGVV